MKAISAIKSFWVVFMFFNLCAFLGRAFISWDMGWPVRTEADRLTVVLLIALHFIIAVWCAMQVEKLEKEDK